MKIYSATTEHKKSKASFALQIPTLDMSDHDARSFPLGLSSYPENFAEYDGCACRVLSDKCPIRLIKHVNHKASLDNVIIE